MTNQDIIQQLEFFRDIGVESVSISKPEPAAPELSSTAAKAAASPEAPAPILPTPTAPSEALEDIRADIGDRQRCKPAQRTTIVSVPESKSRNCVCLVAPGTRRINGLAFVERPAVADKDHQFTGIKREDAYICNFLAPAAG
jgi:hypothetical protein